MKMELTYLSLGSNIGDRESNIQSALNQIDRKIGNIISISKLYENPSVGFDGDITPYDIDLINADYMK